MHYQSFLLAALWMVAGSNVPETRTWKFIGYILSKAGGGGRLGTPVVIPTVSPTNPTQISFIPPVSIIPFPPSILPVSNPTPLLPIVTAPATSESVAPPFQPGGAGTLSPETVSFPNFEIPSPTVGPPPPSSQVEMIPSPTIGPAPPPVFFMTEPPASSFPTAPPAGIPELMVINNNSTSTVPALPLPTGLTSLATTLFVTPGIPLAQAQTIPAGCACVAAGTCVTTRTAAGTIDIRIVTQIPSVVCPAGQQYCCSQNQAQTDTCGIPNIIAGVTPSVGQANLGEYPWSGIIMTAAGQYVGGAALITSTHLLTAAHVVAAHGNGVGLKVRLGEWDLSGVYEPVQFVELPVLNIVIHPSFVASTLQNDLALITLQAPATLVAAPTPQVNTICLPAATDVFLGQQCRVAGWGKDSFTGNPQNIIKHVDVPVMNNVDCQARMRTTKLGAAWALDTTSFICAGGEVNKDACQGDGGNALVCLNNGRFVVAGITAGGVQCGLPGIPGLYVNVNSYLPWITSQVTGQLPVGTIDPRRPNFG